MIKKNGGRNKEEKVLEIPTPRVSMARGQVNTVVGLIITKLY